MVKYGLVYAIINIENNKRYVGSTYLFKDRKYCHLYLLRKGSHHSKILQRAYNKYGEKSFRFEILEENIPMEQLMEREQYYIIQKGEYNTNKEACIPPRNNSRAVLYDINGNYLNTFPSLKSCCDSINAYSRYGYNKGYFVLKTNESIQDVIYKHSCKYGRNKKVYKFSKDGDFICCYESISEALKSCGNPKSGNGLITKAIKYNTISCGFRWSFSETINIKKDLRSNRSKAIIVRNTETGMDMYFNSIKECCDKLNISKSTIQRNTKKKTKTRYGLILEPVNIS